MIHASAVRDLLDRADGARAAGRGVTAGSLYYEAANLCRIEGDLEGWTEAALGAASVHQFGTDPGQLPAHLHDILTRSIDDTTSARVAAALARCWAYAGHPTRALQFAERAVAHAHRVGDAALTADCLDAALATRWGPDDLEARRSLAAQLDEVAAHVLDPETRLKSHLWGLQVACEALDLPAIHRQMRALERLGEESPRAQFFAASRRLMLDLLRGRTDTAAHLTSVAAEAASRASLADAWMVLKVMESASAAQSGDTAACAAGAAAAEAFALAEGVTAVSAESAYLWVRAGRLDRAQALVHTFHGPVLDALPRDVNWLLTLQCVLEAALAVDDREVIGTASRLLTPYHGRAVMNAGAVVFHGVTDDTLARAAAVLGDPDTAGRLRAQALSTYERIGASWWRDRLESWRLPMMPDAAEAPDPRRAHLRPCPGGLWQVGSGDAVPLRALRGFGYLRELLRRPGQPVAALDLAGGGSGVVVESGLGEVIDKQALDAYRQRLAELDHELAEAEEWADLGRLDSVRDERDALAHEVARAVGWKGRLRTTGSSNERARVAVQKAIATAVDRIATIDEPLARHLKTCVHTGLSCSYEPDPSDTWDWVLD